MTCEHLAALERDLRATGASIHSDGRSWWGPSRGIWMYFGAYLRPEETRAAYGLPEFVVYYEYDGRVAGQEAGFECTRCESAVVGVHPLYRAGLPVFPPEGPRP